MVCLPEYKCGRAELCVMNGRHYVRLPDRQMIDCGDDLAIYPFKQGAEKRAEFVRDCINCALKWTSSYPVTGVIESVVRFSFQDEDKWEPDYKDE